MDTKAALASFVEQTKHMDAARWEREAMDVARELYLLLALTDLDSGIRPDARFRRYKNAKAAAAETVANAQDEPVNPADATASKERKRYPRTPCAPPPSSPPLSRRSS